MSPYPLIQMLADGKFHSGETLGRALGLSRSAVWKGIAHLRELSLEIHAVSGKGYRLASPLTLLDPDEIRRHIAPQSLALLEDIAVHPVLDSTNAYLLKNKSKRVIACLAEQQTAGRGRRGRTWVSPFGHNIYLSIRWEFACGPAQLGGLSLAMGVAIIEALEECGLAGCRLKWPNDILAKGRKLAGILIDVRGETSGPCTVVTGVGLNRYLPLSQGSEISQPWIDTQAIISAQALPRNKLAAKLIQHIVATLQLFSQQGFAAFRSAWMALDQYRDQTVTLQTEREVIRGIVRGVDEQGALLLACEQGIKTFHFGEVSLRAAGSEHVSTP